MKKKFSMKSLMSLVLCVITVLGSFPMPAYAQTMDENGAVAYEIGDRVWVRGEDVDPSEEAPQGTYWMPEFDESDQPVIRQGLCQKTEHSHIYPCAPDCPLAHVHSDGCYTLTYPNCIEHSHDEYCTAVTVYACNKTEHDHAISGCAAAEVCSVHGDHSQCDMTSSYTCGIEAHDHAVPGCPAEEVCTVHDHSQCDMTKAYTCGMEAHAHDESCTTLAYPDCTEHSHDKNCLTENMLSCGVEEHICVTEGCAPDCALEEHSHTADCDMDAVYYSWELVEDTSSTFAESSEKGLPVHFFIALPGQAADPNGTYVSYGKEYWGRRDGRGDNLAYALPLATNDQIIYSEYGIRNVSDESLITYYVDDTTKAIMNTLKDVENPVVNGTTYTGYKIKWVTICQRNILEASGEERWKGCNCSWDGMYPHIHIDAVLTKEVAPADMKLTKTIPAAEAYPQTFTFNLQRLLQDSSYNPINQFDEVFGTKSLSATIPAGQTQASIVSTDGSKVGFGYYKLTENASTGWQIKRIVIERTGNDQIINGGDLYIQIARDGTMKFSQSYNGQWVTATGITIENERSPLDVTYDWVGIPDGLTTLPDATTGLAYNSVHNINTTYPIGDIVLGQKGIIDPADNTDSAGYYYEFQGWQHIDPAVGERQIIQYDANGVMTPSSFNVTSDTVIHGLWTRHELPKAEGYITIEKTFENKPADASFTNFRISVIHNNRIDITPVNTDGWNEAKTQWTYQYPISESGDYTITEGKYDVAGYSVTPAVTVTPVAGISTAGNKYESDFIISDGHKYKDFGQTVSIMLPYDTAALSDGVSVLDNDIGIHTATVSFTNTYQKETAETVHNYPNLIVRKTDSFSNPLTGAQFQLKNGENIISGTTDGPDVRYAGLAEGVYTLKETVAPTGYKLLDTEYTLTVEKDGEAVEQLKLICNSQEQNHAHDSSCYKYVPTQEYKLSISANGVDVNDEAIPGEYETLTYNTWFSVPNERMTADLTITKTFSDISDANNSAPFVPDSGSIVVDIYGPVQRDDAGNIMSIGSLWKNDVIISASSVDADGNSAPWQTTVQQLPYGEYFVEEVMASIHGYKWQEARYNSSQPITVGERSGFIVNVDGNSDTLSLGIENRYTLWDAADFYVVKTDGTQKRLPGAEFKLYDSNNNDVTAIYAQPGTGITNANGYIYFDGFTLEENETSKTFTLKEVKAPNGYYLSNAVYTVTVTKDAAYNQYDITVSTGGTSATYEHSTDELTVPNSPILGEITVTKEFEGDAPPEGSYVTVRLANESRTVVRTANLTAKDSWQYTFKNLPLDTYTLTEIYSSALGYSYTTQYKVNNAETATDGNAATLTITDTSNGTLTSLPDSAKGSVEFINTYTRVEKLTVNAGSFIVFKRDETGAALPGAEFTLYSDEACTQILSNVPEGFTVTATSGGADGAANFTGLKLADHAYGAYKTAAEHDAIYYLKESKAPDGYQLSDTVWKIRLKEDHVQIDKLTNNSFFETIVNWIAGRGNDAASGSDYEWTTDHALAVVNYPIKGSVNITKSFTGVTDEDYEDARIELHVHGPITRNTDGSIKDIGPLVQKIELQKDENSSFPTTATVENLDLGEYVIREPFASIHGYSWTNEEYYLNGGTTAAEEISINGTDGFVLFTVESADPVEISVTNSYTQWDAADFYIRKMKTGTDTGLAGAVFKLYTDPECKNEATGIIATPETGIAGYAHFDGLEVEQGQTEKLLYLKEVKAPTNYRLPDTVYTVTVTHDTNAYDIDITVPDGSSAIWFNARDTLWVYNEEILGSITVSKVFEGIDDEDKPEKISLRLRGHGKDQEIVLPENGKWEKTIPNLPMGNYIVYEQAANVDGYTLQTSYAVTAADVSTSGQESSSVSAEYAAIHLTPDNTQMAVTVTNTYEKKSLTITPASFKVKKLESGSNKPLKDAVFILRDEDGAEITRATTGENGLALFNDLKMPDKDYEDYKAPNRSVTYYLSEIAAPEGYVRDETVWKVQLSENVTLFDKEENGKFGIVDWIAGIFQTGSDTAIEGDVLTVYNSRKSYPVSVKKTVSYQGLTDPANDYMVKYSLSKAEYEFALYIDGEPVETMKLKADEEKSFTRGVPYGSSYEVREIVAPNAIYSSSLSANAKGSIGADSAEEIAVTAENTYRFTDGGKPIVLEMVKVSGDIYRKPLAGARFSLRDSGNELLGAYESDAYGRFYISGVFNAPGTYWLIENRAPAGYRAGGPIAIDVKYDISVIRNSENQPVIVRTPVATVTGSHVFHIANNAYGVKNDVIFTPKTGDDNDLMRWTVLSLFGLLGTGSAFALSRRKRYKSRH